MSKSGIGAISRVITPDGEYDVSSQRWKEKEGCYEINLQGSEEKIKLMKYDRDENKVVPKLKTNKDKF